MQECYLIESQEIDNGTCTTVACFASELDAKDYFRVVVADILKISNNFEVRLYHLFSTSQEESSLFQRRELIRRCKLNDVS